MKWEIPPHSKSGKYKLVGTNKMNGDIYLSFIGYGSIEVSYCGLHEVGNYSEELQEYVLDLLPKIVSGVYDLQLIDEELEEG